MVPHPGRFLEVHVDSESFHQVLWSQGYLQMDLKLSHSLDQVLLSILGICSDNPMEGDPIFKLLIIDWLLRMPDLLKR